MKEILRDPTVLLRTNLRDWTIDYDNRLGYYALVCTECHNHFFGHTKRKLCFVCGNPKK